MEELKKQFIGIMDKRQEVKVKHNLIEIIIIVILAVLADAEDWQDVAIFAKLKEKWLKKFLELEHGIPSHDTIERVMKIVDSKQISNIFIGWFTDILKNKGLVKENKIISIDGKTSCGTGNKNNKPLHVVSAWAKENGICLGEIAVNEKSNEITAIPDLLDNILIKGQIITIDAMGTQTKIVEKIIDKEADYVLAVKGNQGQLHQNIIEYFDEYIKKELSKSSNYIQQIEKSHGQIETREYYITDDITWLEDRNKWKNIKTIGMIEKTVEKDNEIKKETRYYISSLDADVKIFSESVRGHWSIENNLHWHLDVTFREDNSKIIDKTSALNMNIIRKLCLNILKQAELGKISLKKKRYKISLDTEKYLEEILNGLDITLI